MLEIAIVARLIGWARALFGGVASLTTGDGRAGARDFLAARAKSWSTGSASQALVIAAVTLVALGGYTWFIMHVQYGWDNAALTAGLAKKNQALGTVNAEQSAQVAAGTATRAAQVAEIVKDSAPVPGMVVGYVEKRVEVPGPERIVEVAVPYAVPGSCPASEAHRLADTPAALRAKLNAIK